MSYIGKAVKFQHRVATGHSVLDKPVSVSVPDENGKPQARQIPQHLPVPTELRIDDALILSEYLVPNSDQPRALLIFGNGKSVIGADWHGAVGEAHDVPHLSHDGAEDGERFWFEASEVPASDAEEDGDGALSGSSSGSGPVLVSTSGSSSPAPSQPADSGGDQATDNSNGQQDGKPVAGVASQVQGEQTDGANAAPKIAGDAAQVNPAPSSEQPAQQQASADDSAASAPASD